MLKEQNPIPYTGNERTLRQQVRDRARIQESYWNSLHQANNLHARLRESKRHFTICATLLVLSLCINLVAYSVVVDVKDKLAESEGYTWSSSIK